MPGAIEHVVQRLETSGWTITHVSPDALIVKGESMGFFRVHARKGDLFAWIDGRKPRADGSIPLGLGAFDFPSFEDHARRTRRITARDVFLLAKVVDGAQGKAEIEAARPLWKNERSFQEELMSLYSERGWTLDAKRSTERNDGYDDPAWNVAGKRGGDVLDLGFVASLVTFDDVGVVKIGDAGDAWVRTGSKFGTAKVHVRAEAEAVLALF